MSKKSMQEEFWAGVFGDNYVDRNSNPELVTSNIALFAQIMRRTEDVESICELGANIGLNLIALHTLLPKAKLTGVEINRKAAEKLSLLPYVTANNCSIYEITSNPQYDFIFTKGVLIHQNPDLLSDFYSILYRSSNRYIMICEYYNPSPVEVEYRGNKSVLFKRDFAGEIMTKYPDLKLLDYGFVYHKDNNFPGDDFTWFLMEKR